MYVGKRGRMLLFFGSLDVVYAGSIFAPEASVQRLPFYVWVTAVAPLWLWALWWLVTGVVLLVSAFRRDDRVGWAAAIGLKIGWGILSLGGWLFGHVERGYVSAAIWLGLAYAVSVIATWPEPDGGKVWRWTRRRL